jgi:hypothetical protein
MKTKRNTIIALWVGIITAIIGYWVIERFKSPKPPQHVSSSTAEKKQKPEKPRPRGEEALRMLPHIPIEFYGKIVDQHGEPIANAEVKLSGYSSPKKTPMMLTSDPQGRFEVKNLKGPFLRIYVKKEGYINYLGVIDKDSDRHIDYDLDAANNERYKDPKNPTLFHLYKLGPSEPLIHHEDRRPTIHIDGSITKISLDNLNGEGKRGDGPHQIEVKYQSRRQPGNDRYYDWYVEASIPGGGFFKNNDEYQFEAPASGYVETIRHEYTSHMPKDKWTPFVCVRYFVKFPDGTHGIIILRVSGSRVSTSENQGLAHPLSIEQSWINPKVGSRNLTAPKPLNSTYIYVE